MFVLEGESVSQSDLKANKGYGFKVEVIREYEKRNDREISLKSGKGKAYLNLLLCLFFV